MLFGMLVGALVGLVGLAMAASAFLMDRALGAGRGFYAWAVAYAVAAVAVSWWFAPSALLWAAWGLAVARIDRERRAADMLPDVRPQGGPSL